MWKYKRGAVTVHGGSTGRVDPGRDFRFRSKHFAIESPWFYMHVGSSVTRHPDRDEAYHMGLKASGMPEKYHGTFMLHTLVSFPRFKVSQYWTADYGRKTLDYIELEQGTHKRIHPEEAVA